MGPVIIPVVESIQHRRGLRRRVLLFLGAGAAGTTVIAADEHRRTSRPVSAHTYATQGDLTGVVPADGAVATTLGFHVAGDGGGAMYVFRAGDRRTADGITTIRPSSGAGRWSLVVQGRNNVRWYGARGDGSTDDTQALQAALDHGSGGGLYLPSGTYVTTGVRNRIAKSIVGDGPNHTIVRALRGTRTLYSARQAAETAIHGIWFDGNGHARTCVDTDWTVPAGGGAPSQGNSYRDVRVTGYTETGWSARSNNDSPFQNVLIDRAKAAPSAVALDLDAPGGQVVLTDCRFFGPVSGRWQIAAISGSVLAGLRITGEEWNVIAMHGGYWYADPELHSNLHLGAGFGIYPGAFTGVHIENDHADGAVIGGPGGVQSALSFVGCHVFGVGAGKDAVPFVASTVRKSGPQIRVVLDGGILEHLAPTLSATGDAAVVVHDTSFGGFYRPGT